MEKISQCAGKETCLCLYAGAQAGAIFINEASNIFWFAKSNYLNFHIFQPSQSASTARWALLCLGLGPAGLPAGFPDMVLLQHCHGFGYLAPSLLLVCHHIQPHILEEGKDYSEGQWCNNCKEMFVLLTFEMYRSFSCVRNADTQL